MQSERDRIDAALGAVTIESDIQHRWFGKPWKTIRPSIAERMGKDARRKFSEQGIADRLYSNFYCTGLAVPDSGLPYLQQDLFIETREALSEANTGRGYLDPGWLICGETDSGYLARRGGFYTSVAPHHIQDKPRAGLRKGSMVSIRRPKENRRLVPGFYMAFGNAGLPATGPSRRVRIYLNIVPETAACLLRALTGALNDNEIPFIAKILNGRSARIRCDNFVLYVSSQDYAKVIAAIAATRRENVLVSRGLVPIFTRQLGPGISVAVDPADGGSFGVSRCQLIADGLLGAWENGASTLRGKRRYIEMAFESCGLDFERPFLDREHVAVNAELSGISIEPPRRASEDHLPVDNDRLLGTAENIGRQLKSSAIHINSYCNWIGPYPDPGRLTKHTGTSFRLLGGDLYGGTSGVGLFLSALCSVANDKEQYGGIAKAAIDHALSRLQDLGRPVAEGLYTGRTGILLASMLSAHLLNSDEIYGKTCDALANQGEPLHYIEEYDLLSGRAGAILGRLVLARFVDSPLRTMVLDQAARLGNEVLEGATRKFGGLAWTTSSDFATQPLTGLSHGVSGIGLALLELYATTGDDRYRDAAIDAVEYENTCFSRERENWLDFRVEGESDSDAEATAMHWCHGAPGIGVSRSRFHQILAKFADDVRTAVNRNRHSLGDSVADGRANFSLCHGLLGNAESLLLVASRCGYLEEDAIALARKAAALGVQRHGDKPDSWDCGGTVLTPSFMLGLAGIGYFYLRLCSGSLPSLLLPSPDEINPARFTGKGVHRSSYEASSSLG